MADKKTKKEFNQRLAELKNIQQPHLGPWKDLRDYQAPNRGNFDEDKGKEGQRMDLKVYNGTPALSARTLAAGMFAGITSPSRPWFRLGMARKDLNERADVKVYLRGSEQVMYRIFSKSNFYSMTPIAYLEIGVFGQVPMSIKADFEDVARFDTYTIGEYWIAANARKTVDVLYRRIWKTAAQLIEEFGKDKVSSEVITLASAGSPDKKVKVIHAVEPNDDRIPNMIDAKNKKYRSVYYEAEATTDDLLKVSGFDEFPYVVPRWSVNGSDPYGTDQPGIIALGDSKQLQSEQFQKAKGIVKNISPAIQAPSDIKNSTIMDVPGGVTYYNPFSGAGQFGIKPLYEVRVPLKDIIEDLLKIEERIRNAYYVNLFLSILANSRPQDMKAEVAFQIDKERLLMLGPVLESLNHEFLDPIIDRVFGLADDAGILPEPPADLEGEDLRVEYISSLAKAQKMSAISNMERLAGFAGSLESVIPGTMDKIDGDQMVDEAGEILDVPSNVVRSDEDTDEVRKAKAQIQSQQAALQAGEVASKTAKNLAEAPVGSGSILEQLVGVP